MQWQLTKSWTHTKGLCCEWAHPHLALYSQPSETSGGNALGCVRVEILVLHRLLKLSLYSSNRSFIRRRVI